MYKYKNTVSIFKKIPSFKRESCFNFVSGKQRNSALKKIIKQTKKSQVNNFRCKLKETDCARGGSVQVLAANMSSCVFL